MNREFAQATDWRLARMAEPEEAPANFGIWPIYVGLFLALLTFFILLVSLMPPEADRASAVVESVQRAFAPAAPEADADALFVAGRSMLAELGGNLKGIVRIVRVEYNRRGDEMRVHLATADLFAEKSAIRPETDALLDRVVAALGSPPPGLRLQVSFALGRPQPDATAAADGSDLSLAIARCGAVVRELLARGASATAIAIAIDPGPPERATFTFRFKSDGRIAGAAAVTQP